MHVNGELLSSSQLAADFLENGHVRSRSERSEPASGASAVKKIARSAKRSGCFFLFTVFDTLMSRGWLHSRSDALMINLGGPRRPPRIAMRGFKPLPRSGSQGIASPAAHKLISHHWTAELFTVVKSSACPCARK